MAENDIGKDVIYVSKVLLEIFKLKDYSVQEGLSVLAYSMFHVVCKSAKRLEHDQLYEIDKFLGYLGDIRKELRQLTEDKEKAS